MRTRLKAIAPALLALSLIGCSEADRDSACSFDADCGQERACVVRLCRVLCVSDDSCEDESVCRIATRADGSPVRVCAGPDEDLRSDPPPEPTRCASDARCRIELSDERAVCGIAGLCLIPPDETGAL